MTNRCALVAALAVVLMSWAPGAAAGQSDTSGSWTPPKTADGQPDLQGTWANNSATPMERPEQFGDKARLTDEELAALTAAIDKFRDGEQAGDLLGDSLIKKALDPTYDPEFDKETGDYNAFWLAERRLDNRTSLIIDPPNGQRPPQTEAARARGAERGAFRRDHPADGPEVRGLGDRCLHFSVPNTGSGYNSYFQLLQTPGQVTIIQEMGHFTRVIPIDGRPHLDDKIPQWGGSSRGHWEGDTLVVESRNYDPRSRFNGGSENLVLVERFSRIAPNVLRQELTLTDADTWTQPWTIELLFEQSQDAIFEYACHEGNYAMPGILGGARAEERAAAKASK
jgi:hypothetical protein